MKKIFGNLFGLLGAAFSTLLILFGEGDVSISSEYLDIKLTQEVDLYDILFTIEDSAPFKIPVLVGLILTIAAVVFFFLAILISLPKKTGKGVMGVLGIISLIVSSILLMTSFFLEGYRFWHNNYLISVRYRRCRVYNNLACYRCKNII